MTCATCHAPDAILRWSFGVAVCSTSCGRALGDREALAWVAERRAMGDTRTEREVIAAWDRSVRKLQP